MDVRAQWRPAMWLGAGISLLQMDDLRPLDLERVKVAAKHYEEVTRDGS